MEKAETKMNELTLEMASIRNDDESEHKESMARSHVNEQEMGKKDSNVRSSKEKSIYNMACIVSSFCQEGETAVLLSLRNWLVLIGQRNGRLRLFIVKWIIQGVQELVVASEHI
jgi:hypothetical protein